MKNLNKQKLNLAKVAARDAGKKLAAGFGESASVVDQRGREMKILAEEDAERLILERLSVAGIPALAEESGGGEAMGKSGEFWVVDPLDGTFNYVRGMSPCCVSIGLWAGEDPVMGVIYDFVNCDMYSGIVGEGAWINGRQVRVSAVSETGQAALVTGFPSEREYDEQALTEFVKLVRTYKKIRMLGSAAMSLTHVATGRVEVYREESIWIWDVAAGLALVKASGGKIKISEPDEEWKMDVLATNGVLGEIK